MKEKRDFVLQQLRTMPGVKLAVPPDGAFYVLPDVSVYCGKGNDSGDFLDDTHFCLDLLEQQRLALVPGSSFGAPRRDELATPQVLRNWHLYGTGELLAKKITPKTIARDWCAKNVLVRTTFNDRRVQQLLTLCVPEGRKLPHNSKKKDGLGRRTIHST
jgi:hypothetical protein